jgi:hypothetical protein
MYILPRSSATTSNTFGGVEALQNGKRRIIQIQNIMKQILPCTNYQTKKNYIASVIHNFEKKLCKVLAKIKNKSICTISNNFILNICLLGGGK